MVSKKVITGLDFTSIENYFEYIFESEVNGNRRQVEDLINAMSAKQKKAFLQYLKDNDMTGPDVEICRELTLKAL